MKKLLAIAFLLSFCSLIPLKAQEKQNYLEFSITADKEYEAISLNIGIEVEAENKDISEAIKFCNTQLSQVKSDISAQTSEKDVEVSIKYLNSFPETSFFSDYYKVKSRAEIKVNDKKLSEKIFTILKNYPKIKITNVNFKYKDDNEIENDLIIEAGKLAEEKIKVFKTAFKKDYELVSISANNNRLKSYARNGIDDIVALNAGVSVNKNGYNIASDNLFLSYPSKKFTYTLYLKYLILPLATNK